MADGFATKTNGKIDVNTVSKTERAAKINWLVTNGYRVADYYNSDTITIMFEKLKRDDVTIIQINVTEAE